jgi:hypothetical protein
MTRRALTAGERAELSDGLDAALASAGAAPMVETRAHPAAHLARLRFGALPIMAVGRTIWWPSARPDFAGTAEMAVLQHELQHILDFAERRLTVPGYLLRPRNWTYRWDLDDGRGWDRLGAEQRASLAEALWRAERSAGGDVAARLRRVIPWAGRGQGGPRRPT